MLVTDRAQQCFHPAIEMDGEGRICLAYDYAEGCHRNVEMKILGPGDRRSDDDATRFSGAFTDQEYSQEKDVRYYYVRVIQENEQIGWSSPVWVNG